MRRGRFDYVEASLPGEDARFYVTLKLREFAFSFFQREIVFLRVDVTEQFIALDF